MKREMLKMVKENKMRAAELIQYATPKNGRYKNFPTIEHVTEILLMSIPYCCGERPVITSISIAGYSKNNIIKSARFRVETADGKIFMVTAYQNLKGRTQEEKEADKTATFPSGLFNIFHETVE